MRLWLLLTVALWCQSAVSQTYQIQGQLSGWTYFTERPFSDSQLGLRYIPALSLEKPVGAESAIDVEASLDMIAWGRFEFIDELADNGQLETYRLWFRFSTAQFEARAGLQKINFGSATILRPLMWFDRLDPRDPLQLTEGVYGLLARYYFLNNANIWLWGLYGNDETKGWEVAPTEEQSLEYGGRFQYPLWNGEIALTYHHRRADLARLSLPFPLPGATAIPENRFALDGTWDLGIGLWFEGVIIHQDFELLPLRYRNLLTLGSDYTFALGNGLHALGEHLVLTLSEEPFGSDERMNFSAAMVNYNLGLLDRLVAIVFYDWENHRVSGFASWGRTYDNWSFYLNGFWNPKESVSLGFNRDSASGFGTGKGLQILLVFNH